MPKGYPKKSESESSEVQAFEAGLEAEVSPEYKHKRKLAAQEKERKRVKSAVVATEYDFAVSKFGKPKYRKKTLMSSGNSFSVAISKAEYDAAVQPKKKKG